VEVKQLKNPRFALEFQLTQIAQKFMKVASPPKQESAMAWHHTHSSCARAGELAEA
jgi:hypothetical protein